jgi:hypothetical protein
MSTKSLGGFGSLRFLVKEGISKADDSEPETRFSAVCQENDTVLRKSCRKGRCLVSGVCLPSFGPSLRIGQEIAYHVS